jgi:hypothetical protein
MASVPKEKRTILGCFAGSGFAVTGLGRRLLLHRSAPSWVGIWNRSSASRLIR